uniref:Ribulose bisphosphate carboxylase large subunit C-terminal domain-containing protein n=1 Tax=Gossypium raimondii TaxID=29730 RepID=A0A0D2VTV2_GOSRA|nr:hypothetical protein B456_012G005100 [Gossypium raimondii]
MGIALGFIDLLRDDFIEKDRSRGVLFVASRGIHVWHMPALTKIFGDDSVLQFCGGTLRHPWGNAPGAGNEIIREASKWSPKLAAACEE